MEATDAGDFFLRIADLVRVDRLFCSEHNVDALGRNDRLPLIIKYKGRVLSVKNYDIDLFAEHSLAIDNMGRRGLITLREIGIQKLQPDLLACIAFPDGPSSCGQFTTAVSLNKNDSLKVFFMHNATATVQDIGGGWSRYSSAAPLSHLNMPRMRLV